MFRRQSFLFNGIKKGLQNSYQDCIWLHGSNAWYPYELPGVIFTTLHFLHNLLRAQWARVFVNNNPFQASFVLQSSFLGPFVSLVENEMLWLWSLIPSLKDADTVSSTKALIFRWSIRLSQLVCEFWNKTHYCQRNRSTLMVPKEVIMGTINYLIFLELVYFLRMPLKWLANCHVFCRKN